MGLLPRLRSLLKVGIRLRLIVLMTVAACALAFDSYIEIASHRDQRVEEVKARLQIVAQGAADHQYEFASASRLLLGVITRLAPSIDACGDDFRQLAAESKWLKAIAIADPKGMLVCSTNPLSPNINVADRAYFKEVLRTRGFVLSEYLIGRVQNAPVVLAAAPRMDYKNDIDSVIILTIDLGWLNQVAESTGGGTDTEVLLLDRSFTVVSSNKKSRELAGRSLARDPLFRKLAQNDRQVLNGVGPDGVRRLYASAELAGTGARLVIGYPEDDLVAPVREEAKAQFGKNALFFFVLFAISWVLAERLIVRPIRVLTQAASSFGSGERATRVDAEKLPDDFTGLADTFNATADLLASNEALIVEKNRRLAEANARLADLAQRDALTGLANRRVLNGRLEEVFASCEDAALIVIDLDKFKPVNDLMGHAVGDLVLKEAANRLNLIAQEGELVARLGGDEFAMVVRRDGRNERSIEAAKAVVRAMSSPFATRTGHVEIGGTVGIAVAHEDATEPDELLRAADLAMYRAKRDDRGGYRSFEKSMYAELQARVTLETELRSGIRAGEIIPYFQPLVELGTGRIVGLEILARWAHPSKGILPPGVFIGVAAEVGLTEALTRHVLGAACREARRWPDNISLSMNLSPNQLGDPLLPTLMASIAADCGVTPRRIEVEITEDALIRDFATAQAVMQSFRNLGIKVALDDFGTGYSSLQHLHELRFDKIKIDRSFVADLMVNEDSRKLVTAIIALANNLHLPVTAEGIEDPATADLLREMGCAYGQGYVFGRPMPARDVSALLRGDADRAAVA